MFSLHIHNYRTRSKLSLSKSCSKSSLHFFQDGTLNWCQRCQSRWSRRNSRPQRIHQIFERVSWPGFELPRMKPYGVWNFPVWFFPGFGFLFNFFSTLISFFQVFGWWRQWQEDVRAGCGGAARHGEKHDLHQSHTHPYFLLVTGQCHSVPVLSVRSFSSH